MVQVNETFPNDIKNHVSYVFNNMSADNLVPQGARSLAAMVLT